MELKYILGAILLLYCVLAIISNIIKNRKAEKEKKKLERKEELNEKISKSTEKNIELSKKKKENKQQQHYENVEIVYKFLNQFIIIKRDDNRYSAITYNTENITLYENKDILKIEREKLNTYNWFSKEEYEKYKSIFEEKFKKDSHKIISFLKEKNITKFYHFTDRRNLENIKKMGGLYSWDYLLKSESKNSVIFGSNELSRNLDKRYNLQNYVRLSFCKEHPMMYVAMNDDRIEDPVILEIDIAVAIFKNTLFSDRNAVDTYHNRGGDIENLNKIRFDVFKRSYFDLDDMEKKYYQAEVLVEKFIPLKCITNFNDVI